MTNQPTDDAQAARQQHREHLTDLITRMRRGELHPQGRDILAACIASELADSDQARAELEAARAGDAPWITAYREEAEQARTDAAALRAEHEQHRLAIARALGRWGGPGTVPQTWDLLIEHTADTHRWATDGALGRTPAALRAKKRAEDAEAGRRAADDVIRATLAALGAGPDTDPVVKARETLARAERAEAAIARIRDARERVARMEYDATGAREDAYRRALNEFDAALNDEQPAEPEPIAPEPIPCDTYQPSSSPEESGLCASCGMADWKHTATPDGAALWAAIRDHAARDHQFWNRLSLVRGLRYGQAGHL